MNQLSLKYNDGDEHRVDRWGRRSLKYIHPQPCVHVVSINSKTRAKKEFECIWSDKEITRNAILGKAELKFLLDPFEPVLLSVS